MTVYYCTEQSTSTGFLSTQVAYRGVRCPESQYKTVPTQKDLQDAVEDHLSMYHYHQTALLELARSESAPDSHEWEYGAYLTGSKLLEQSEWLIDQLSRGNRTES